jgi:hypothetical protein
MNKVFCVLIFCALFLVSCGNAATPTATPLAPTAQPVVNVNPTSPAKPASTVATSKAGMATINVTLVRNNTEPQKPYVGLKVFVGTVITGNDGKSKMARVDPKNAPFAFTDENGHLTVTDIPPGEYVLVVSLPPNNLIKLNKPETGGDMMFTLTADQSLDLGVLGYDFTFDDYTEPTTPQTYPAPVEPTAYPAP